MLIGLKMEDHDNGPYSRERNSQIKICNSLFSHMKFIKSVHASFMKTKGTIPRKKLGIIVQ